MFARSGWQVAVSRKDVSLCTFDNIAAEEHIFYTSSVHPLLYCLLTRTDAYMLKYALMSAGPRLDSSWATHVSMHSRTDVSL